MKIYRYNIIYTITIGRQYHVNLQPSNDDGADVDAINDKQFIHLRDFSDVRM